MTTTHTVQRLAIVGWHPAQVANGSHGHWATRKKHHDEAAGMAWAHAQRAGWSRVTSRARLRLTYVFPQQRRRDIDNLVARSKGFIDGLKPWLVDDSTDWLLLQVNAEVSPGIKALRVELEELLP